MQLQVWLCTLLSTLKILVVRVDSSPADKSYMGCYKDDESNRAMSIQNSDLADNTVGKCVDFCRENYYTFAGLGNGVDCHCGEEFHKHGQSEDCNVACSGDNSATCGGQASLSIYSVCPPGMYGYNCELSCPIGCGSGNTMCQINTGQCCQGDIDQSSEVHCNFFRQIDCGNLSGDPRPEVGDMTVRAGTWLNLFTTMTFTVNAKVTGVTYFSHSNKGTVYVSFWRNQHVNSSQWLMVAKMELHPKMEGLQQKQLKPSEVVYVRAGDAVAIHYPNSSGIIPYENYPAKRSDLQDVPFHKVLNTPSRGVDWKPGHVISFAGADTHKRLAAIKIQYDCIKECRDGFYGEDCSQSCGQCQGHLQCHYSDGSCPSGCQLGYKNYKCDQACDNNTYGEQCQHYCSRHCQENQCDRVTGVCTKGCLSGYTGEKCDHGVSHLVVMVVSILLPLVILATIAVALIYIFWWKPWQRRKNMGLPKATVFKNETTVMTNENGTNNTAFEDPLLLNEQKPAYSSVEI